MIWLILIYGIIVLLVARLEIQALSSRPEQDWITHGAARAFAFNVAVGAMALSWPLTIIGVIISVIRRREAR